VQTFDQVTVLFTHVVGFATICANIKPTNVVSWLNEMYMVFDELVEKHGVYKVRGHTHMCAHSQVDTIGDAYMLVSGAPTPTPHHAEFICDYALALLAAVAPMIESTSGQDVKIRGGRHNLWEADTSSGRYVCRCTHGHRNRWCDRREDAPLLCVW
jgi:guanylate cyclase